MSSLATLLKDAIDYLTQVGIQDARRQAEELFADVLGVKRLDLYLQFERPISNHEQREFKLALARRAQHEPIAYISGEVAFGGLKFQVNPHVLIPRPETEILVENISQVLGQHSLENKVLWDVCCGSGCIGLSLKHRFPQLTVVLSDLSQEALNVAKLNASLNALDRVSFKSGDLFTPFANLKCDFFVCNPPYISEREYHHLNPDVRNWEPKMALLAGQTGLEFYQRVADELSEHLNPGGLGWLELGRAQGLGVKNIFETKGYTCSYTQDWSGHDRFFFIENF